MMFLRQSYTIVSRGVEFLTFELERVLPTIVLKF